ncbi:MAG: hypothetical protein ACREA3_07735 [Nitrosotalea sp.]
MKNLGNIKLVYLLIMGSTVIVLFMGIGFASATCIVGPNGTKSCTEGPLHDIVVNADSPAYADNDTITISGIIDNHILSNYGTRLHVDIYNPQMVLYKSDQFNANTNGSFTYSFVLEGKNATTGFYTVHVSPDLKIGYYGTGFMYQATPYYLEINGTFHPLEYALSAGTLDKVDINPLEKSITIHIVNSTSSATLRIKLPRNLIDSKSNGRDANFTVLADTPIMHDMKNANFNQVQTNSNSRTLLIQLPFYGYSTDGNWDVKIIGTNIAYTQTYVQPPLKQVKSGIQSKDVQCLQGLQLIIKTEDGSPACVIPQTAQKLVERGWGTLIGVISTVMIPSGNATHSTLSENLTLPASFMPCDTPYELKEGFVPVLYMPANSLGKICVNYSNPNNEKNASLAIFEASAHQPAKYEYSSIQPAKSIITWGEPPVIPIGNSTEVYFVKTSNQTGFYGLTVFCVGMPLAVGYDNQSRIVLDDFPWMKQTTAHCLLQDYNFQVVGVDGIGIKYIPYP